MTRATHLPVVSSTGELVGLLSKDRVQRELSDLGGKREEYEEIPEFILDLDLHESILQYFKEANLIPVIGLDGEKRESWDKPRFLAAFTKLDSKKQKDPKLEEIHNKIDKQKEKQESIHWFMEMILSHFPDGLLATDVNGNSVFYNESFEEKILTKSIFKDSIQTAEKYLFNLSRELIANYLKDHDLNLKSDSEIAELTTTVASLNSFIRVVTLRKDKKVVGFLYHFSEVKEILLGQTGGDSPRLGLDLALQKKLPLEKILEETESFYILETLRKNQKNISHSANDLGIPRTTLQNRIKYLNLMERMEEESKERQVIPRKRSKSNPSESREPKKRIKTQETKTPKAKKSEKTKRNQTRLLAAKPKKTAKKLTKTDLKQKKQSKSAKPTKRSSKNQKKRP